MVNYLSQWLKHNVAVMSDRAFPNNPVELKVKQKYNLITDQMQLEFSAILNGRKSPSLIKNEPPNSIQCVKCLSGWLSVSWISVYSAWP